MELLVFLGLVLLTVGILYVYNTQLKQKDSFQDASGTNVMMEPTYDRPYTTEPIQNVDDYEYNLVFQNEGDRGITKAQRDLLMSKYPMDWSVQPPSSALFQQGLAAYKEAFANPPPPQQGNPYAQVDGSNMVPPDTLGAEMKEREILATYIPKKPQELTTYDAADAKDLIEKIYSAKGLVADYKESKPGVFVVMGTRRKDEKVLYEDEVADATSGPNAAAGERAMPRDPLTPATGPELAQGEASILVPPVGSETAVGLDPFFTAGEKTRDGRWDYTRWTPGLERAFAPTEARTHWY